MTTVRRDVVEDSNAEENQGFNNTMKQMNNKNYPEGEKQASRQAEDWSTVKHETLTQRRHMKDNGSAQDCRHKENYIGRQTRVTRETQLEPLKQ